MNIVKDNEEDKEKDIVEDKLKRLFYDPDSGVQKFYQDNRIILQHSEIWKLFDHFKSAGKQQQLTILKELRHILERCPQNSIILLKNGAHLLPSHNKGSIVEYLIGLAVDYSDSDSELAEEALRTITSIYKNISLAKSHLTVIYQKMAQRFYEQKISTTNYRFALKILQEIFSNQIPGSDEPQNYFYFTGVNSSITVNCEGTTTWQFVNGFALSIWFYLDEANSSIVQFTSKETSNEFSGLRVPKLFTIHSQGHGGVEGYFVGKQLYFRNLPISYTEPTPNSNGSLIGEFKPGQWYYLGLEHERQKMFGKSHLNVVINQDLKKTINIDFPKIPEQAPMTKFVFGEDMIGRISSIIVFKNPVNHLKLMDLYSYFNYGIQINNQLKTINLSMDKILDKILFLYTPIRADGNQVYDAFHRFDGILKESSGFHVKNFMKQKMCFLGGTSSILPFIYLLRFCKTEEKDSGSLLNEILKVILAMLKGKPDNQFEAARTNFFKIAGQLLTEITWNIFDDNTLELLAELKNSLFDPRLVEEYFADFLWKTEIYDYAEQSVREDIFSFIRTIYIQRPLYYNHLFPISKIMDIIIDRIDTRNHSDPQEAESVASKAGPLIKIIEAVLTTGGEEIAEEILPVFRAFTLKCSPKLHLLLFSMLKVLMITDKLPNADVACS